MSKSAEARVDLYSIFLSKMMLKLRIASKHKQKLARQNEISELLGLQLCSDAQTDAVLSEILCCRSNYEKLLGVEDASKSTTQHSAISTIDEDFLSTRRERMW